MEYGQSFSYQTLQEVISKITPDVLEKIIIEIGKMAIDLGVDTGNRLRADSTAIETNIHHPTNCSLLWDCIRVSCRILRDVKKMFNNLKVSIYSKKTAKKLTYTIVNTRGQEKRIPLFKKMLQIQNKFQHQVGAAIEQLQSVSFEDTELEKERQKKLNQLTELLPKMETIYKAAYRKEILDEQVPVDEKLFSIFEDHTDCIKKGNRDVIFGHKVNFTTGKSGIIFDTIIEKGNPPDISFYNKILDNLKDNYSLVPRDFTTDGGFASTENMNNGKERGIKNIVFAKTKGKLQNKVSSKKMETMLKKWRAGIEANISNFKRGIDAGRATWKGYQGFERFVLWSVIAYNLKMLAASLLLIL
jgi:IS5 family transposase